ncbi:AbfB domain-containing protein [Streptomyces sp. NPDC049627]|uniref:AbfB domain-containing protein n=1 Tax=Streptomyces sp. NPDC049627 TaxID=3365595 RepID=UPI0037963F6C
MPENKSRPPQEQPWENGWAPETSRAPGTRRLWLAGGMAAVTVVACVTAIAVSNKAADHTSAAASSSASDTTTPGLISFATPSETTPLKGRSGLATPQATTRAPGQQHATTPRPAPEPSESPSHGAGSATTAPKPPATTTTWRSVRSVNYPDRYWHVSSGYVKLDAVGGSESRKDSTFKLVKGLADASCYSFATADGTYLRHRSFVLRSERHDGSALFRQDATFCPRAAAYSGAVMLESVNYPGRFLRHQDFQLKLDPFQNSSLYLSDSAFQLVAGLA